MQNLNIVDSIEKKETEESKDEEKQNMSTVIWPLALGTVTTEDTLKEKENPTKSSISVALTIEEQNIIEKNVQTDEIALEEQLDNIPSINDGMLDEVVRMSTSLSSIINIFFFIIPTLSLSMLKWYHTITFFNFGAEP